VTSTEREELTRLRRENRRLAEDVEILKRATAFFALQGDPVTVYPFIETERSQQRNVARACVLLKVSRSAFYADRTRKRIARLMCAAGRRGRAPKPPSTPSTSPSRAGSPPDVADLRNPVTPLS